MTQWSGSRLGVGIWEPYNLHAGRTGLRIHHDANIPVNLQIISLKFREIDSHNPLFGFGNFYTEDETGRKFVVHKIDPNYIEIQTFVRHSSPLEYLVEITEEDPDPTITLETGGSVDSYGLQVYYRFDWNDGTVTEWATETKSTHTYRSPGTFYVRAQASSTGLQTAWSEPKVIDVIDTPIFIMTPKMPSGSTQVDLGILTTYVIENEVTPLEAQEYRFDWGDGTYSDWTSSMTSSHFWNEYGTYGVRSQARSRTTGTRSKWSDALEVLAGRVEAEIVSVITTTETQASSQSPAPILQYTGLINTSIQIRSDFGAGADDQVQYRFDFGDSQQSNWSFNNQVTHTWVSVGKKRVTSQVRVRNIQHLDLGWTEYTWSIAREITILDHTLTVPTTPIGVSEAQCKPLGTITSSPQGELKVDSFQRDWLSNWSRIPGSGEIVLDHALGVVPYLVLLEFDLEGLEGEKKYESKRELVDDGTGKDIEVLTHSLTTHTKITVHFHRYYISTYTSNSGKELTRIASRFRMFLRG
jgi:hypothetical protein